MSQTCTTVHRERALARKDRLCGGRRAGGRAGGWAGRPPSFFQRRQWGGPPRTAKAGVTIAFVGYAARRTPPAPAIRSPSRSLTPPRARSSTCTVVENTRRAVYRSCRGDSPIRAASLVSRVRSARKTINSKKYRTRKRLQSPSYVNAFRARARDHSSTIRLSGPATRTGHDHVLPPLPRS